MHDVQIYMNVQDELSVASHRVRCGRVQKVYHPLGSEGLSQRLKLMVVSSVRPYKDAKRSVMKGWKPGNDVQGED